MKWLTHVGASQKNGHGAILAGLAGGGILGTFSHFLLLGSPVLEAEFLWVLTHLIEPAGQIFLRLLFMTVVPLVFASLALGVASLGDVRRLGRMGAWTFAYFLVVTSLAVIFGLLLVHILSPGSFVEPEVRDRLQVAFGDKLGERTEAGKGIGIDYFLQIIPRNPIEAAARGDMLAVIFFSLMVGVALMRIPADEARQGIAALQVLGRVMVAIINMVMKIAPYGVFALIFSVTARFGWEILQQLMYYVLVVLVGLALFQFLGYSLLLRIFSGVSPGTFFRKIRTVMITAFSTSSSNATLPTTLKAAEEELNVPREVAGFVLPLGATMNMNGTALFEGVTVLFLAQVFGIHLDLGEQLLVLLLAVLSAIGTAGVPGGSIPLLVLVLETVGIPGQSIALILGVDRLLDMSRTVLNVTGDLTAALFISRLESAAREKPGGSLSRQLEAAAAQPVEQITVSSGASSPSD